MPDNEFPAEDVPDDHAPTTLEEPTIPKPKEMQRRGERQTWDESDDESNLEFLGLKRGRTAELLEEPLEKGV